MATNLKKPNFTLDNNPKVRGNGIQVAISLGRLFYDILHFCHRHQEAVRQRRRAVSRAYEQRDVSVVRFLKAKRHHRKVRPARERMMQAVQQLRQLRKKELEDRGYRLVVRKRYALKEKRS